jgi:micrococcal nuclease
VRRWKNSTQSRRSKADYFAAFAIVIACAFSSSACAPADSAPPIGSLASEATQDREGPFRVATVIDGDTIKINRRGQSVTVRVVGIDTPEVSGPYTSQECYGKEASARAKKLLAGRDVWLQAAQGQPSQDRYGRDLAFIFSDGTTDFGLAMLRDGYAREYKARSPHQYAAQYRDAEQSARAAQRGLWSPTACRDAQ